MKKKIVLLLALIGMITLQSCVKETVVADTGHNISEIFEFGNVNFTSFNGYKADLDFPYTIYDDDMVLVYRLTGYNSSEGDFWKLLPETYYFDDGTLDYGFSNDFTRNDALITLNGFDLPALNANIRLNQIIRVVVIPRFRSNKGVAGIDFMNYNAVINYYQIDTKNITKLDLK